MSVFALAYLSVSLLWACYLLRYNKAINIIVEKRGAPTATLLAVLQGLAWPVDMVGYLILFIIVYQSGKDRRNPAQPSQSSDPEFGLICHNCGQRHRYLGTNEAMNEIGWKMVRDGADPSHIYWFCNTCDPFEPRHNEWKQL